MANNQISYVDYSLTQIKTTLQNRLAQQALLKDGAYRSSTISLLTDLFAAVGTLVLYYVERRAEESYIGTAKNKSSIINLVRLLNYKPRRNVSAVGTLRFTISPASSNLVFIPQWTECQTTAGVKYLVLQDAAIMPGQLYVDASGIQGELSTTSYVSTGAANQEYNVADTTVENTNIFVYVDNVLWTAVDTFINSETTSEHYVVRPELDDTVTIVFSDGVFGKIPALSSTITIKYVKSNGSTGNVYDVDRITALNSTIYDSTGAVQTVTVTNYSTFLGGEDIETIDEIKYNAPRVFATGDRLVTKEDYIAVLEDYPSIANANAWGEAEETNPDVNNYNRVKLSILLQNWILPDATFKRTITDYLYDKAMMTVRDSFVDPTIIYAAPSITLKVNKGVQLSSVQSAVQTALEDQFVLGETSRLGTSIYLSNLYGAVNAVSGVNYCYIDLKLKKYLSTSYNSSYTYAEKMDALTLTVGTANIYLNDLLIAVDNGLGHFTDVSSAYTVIGDINYTTGVVGVNISGASIPAGSSVYCLYNQNYAEGVVVDRNQIVRLISTDIDFASVTYVS